MTAILAQTRYGTMLLPPFDRYVTPQLIHHGRFSEAEFATWVPYLGDGSVALDVGANVGGHTLALASLVGYAGRVYAFEPQRHLFQMLCGSLELCGARNVVPFHRAASREPGTVRVPEMDYGHPNNFGALDLRAVPHDAPCETVRSMPIDDLNLPRVDFIKIDVEGYELDVLLGAEQTVARCRPVISAEADREQNVPAELGWFKRHDYRVWWHRPPMGPLFPNTISLNLLGLPRERADLPEPEVFVEVAIP